MNSTRKNLHEMDLIDLCASMTATYKKDRTALDGAVFALLTRKLLAAEVRPGGPYKDASGTISVGLNIAIDRLFTTMGMPLPLVRKFLDSVGATYIAGNDKRLSTYHASAGVGVRTVNTSNLSTPYQRVRQTFDYMSEPLKSQSLAFLERVAKADSTGEIAGIATFTARSFGITMSPHALDKLGEANIYGWMAYMIYDHVMDGQSSPALLSVANVAARLSISRYTEVAPKNKKILTLITDYFDDTDAANAWEFKHCRFTVHNGMITMGTLPDYGTYAVLARRSGIHILGPIILANLPAWNLTAQKMQKLTKGLHHYLIARQLSDDLHDWKDDIANGQISAVVAYMLAKTPAGNTLSVKKMMLLLQRNFLEHSMQDMCGIILHHTSQAHTLLAQAGCTQGPLIQLVERIAQMVQASLIERVRFLEFNEAYKSLT